MYYLTIPEYWITNDRTQNDTVLIWDTELSGMTEENQKKFVTDDSLFNPGSPKYGSPYLLRTYDL
jgi:hypothetical protein